MEPQSLFPPERVVISASRRTDLSRCFPDQLAQWLQAGQVLVPNPFNRKVRCVDLRPEAVHTLVLWSKDYARVLANECGVLDQLRRYAQLIFHLTLTGLGGSRLEPGIASPKVIAQQFKALVAVAGHPERVNWRFDPILAWCSDGKVRTNLRELPEWMRIAKDSGLTQVTVSLGQAYAKVRRRFGHAGLTWVDPKPGRVRSLATHILTLATRFGLQVRACCCPPLTGAGVLPAQCVDGARLTRLHPQGWPAPGGKDSGQRKACGCTPAIDIGDYALSCPQGCVYCYANPK
jgi:hypothetical protein